MKKLVLAASVTGSLLFLTTGDLSGHGGVYRGPGDNVPPAAGGGPGTGGPNTGGPTTPGPGGPTTPGGGRGPQTPGGGPGVPGGGGAPRGPVTGVGRKKNAGGEGYEQWQFWWEYNKERYLDLRERLGSSTASSGSIGFLTGTGRKNAGSTSQRPNAGEVNERIVPVLKSVLGSDDADIVDSAVLSLGRIVRADSASLVLEDIRTTLKNSNVTVKQSTILALGVLGAKESVPSLIEIMNDSSEGRQILGERNAVQDLQRAFAAVSLGYIGAPEAIEALKSAVTGNSDSETDLRSAAITALGLFEQEKEGITKFLLDLLKDDKMERVTRAQIPVALGRLGAVAAVPELLRIVNSRREKDLRLEESCVIALGMLSEPQDAEVLKALQDLIEESNNEQARHFSFIALSQIASKAATDKDADRYEGLLSDLVNKFLLKELAKPKKKTHQPWAGLSLALLGRDLDKNSNLRTTITQKMLETFEESNNPDYKAGFAVGLGLLEAIGAGPAIAEVMNDTHDLELKGYLALSLGMMRYTDSLADLRNLVLDNRDPKMRLQISTALGLMGDVQAVPMLLEALKNAETLFVISSLARSIGLIGDRSAIEPLQELVTDERAPGLGRAFACVALGLLGEKTNVPWNTKVTENANYRTVVPFLYEIADIL